MTIRVLFILGIILTLFQAWRVALEPDPSGFQLSQTIPTKGKPVYKESFASNKVTTEVHSAGVVELDNGDVRAVWYGGTREGHSDVAIYTNVWKAETSSWGQEQVALNLAQTTDATFRYARKLGNPVITRAPNGELWLFYVTAVGGWATSSINLATSIDDGKTWSEPKRLISSPAFNFSTLVKGNPVQFKDGTLGLPVYHEFLAKFGELLRLNKSGDVIYKSRQAWGRDSLQPVVMPYGEKEAISMLRYAGEPPNRILTQSTMDAGLSWPTPAKTDLPNPNSAVAGLEIDNGKLFLMVFNNNEEERGQLTLAISKDRGESWKLIHEFEGWDPEKKIPNQGYSYPSLIQTSSNDFHLVYTWHVKQIKHVHFNRAWLDSKL